MTKDEFTALPPAIALGVIFDAMPGLASAGVPQLPRSQKYDGKLSRKGGTYCWMSEMNLESLIYWENLKRTSSTNGSQWAEKDKKTADALAYWVGWRRVFPTEPWSGMRNDERVTAAPPSRDPALHQWDGSGRRNGGGTSKPTESYDDGPAAPAAANYSDADYGGAGGDDLPF
jgi:hypothetical protein